MTAIRTSRTSMVLAAVVVITLTGCDRYAAEVGWRQGGSEKWDISGDYESLDDCRSAAIGQYNSINARNPGQAFSWACLKKNRDGSYESRHR